MHYIYKIQNIRYVCAKVTSCSGLPAIVPASALRVLCPRKPFSSWQIVTVCHIVTLVCTSVCQQSNILAEVYMNI